MPETMLKLPTLERVLENAAITCVRADGLTGLTFPASSEEPVERYFGTEVLSHKKGAVRLERARGGAMPLLFNHNMDDPIGMVDKARVEGGRLVVDAHLYDTDRAREVERMIAGGLRNVSIMYRSYVIEEDTRQETFTVTDWEPFEVSIVTIPSDPTVGIGRNTSGPEFEVRMVRASQPAVSAEGADMDETKSKAPAAESAGQEKNDVPEEMRSNVTSKMETQERSIGNPEPRGPVRSAMEIETERVEGIRTLAKMAHLTDDYVDMWIGQGTSVNDVSKECLKLQEQRSQRNPNPASKLGMSKSEVKKFSLARAIRAVADKDWKGAAFELDTCRQLAEKLGKPMDPRTILIPFDVLERDLEGDDRAAVTQRLQRDLTVGTAGAGGYLVSTDNVGFIELLRNRMVAFRMGARRLSGLQGSVSIPRMSASGTGYWLATEATQITESQQTFQQVALTPKTVGGYTEISRQLLLQSSPGAEGIVTDDLAQIVAIAADLGVLEGSGSSGQPTGISNTSGIGSVSGTSLAYAGVLEFQSDVAASNVMPVAGGYVTTAAVAALLAARMKVTNDFSPLWDGNIWNATMAGFPAMSSEQLTAASMIFGDWQEVVVGEWGVLEVEVNPYANFQAGIIGVRAMYSMDVGVRRPAAFSRATSIT